MESQEALDSISWQILQELQQNGRLSFSELGRRVGLTPPAVAERVRRLEDAGIIEGYRAVVNLAKVGRPLVALVRLASDERRCSQFAAVAKQTPEVLECCRVTGADSYIVKVAVSSVHHLEELLDRLMPYGQTITSLVLSTPVTHRVIGPSESTLIAATSPNQEARRLEG